jgi:hypothetical protein
MKINKYSLRPKISDLTLYILGRRKYLLGIIQTAICNLSEINDNDISWIRKTNICNNLNIIYFMILTIFYFPSFLLHIISFLLFWGMLGVCWPAQPVPS